MMSNLVFILRRRWPLLVLVPLLAVVLVVVFSPSPEKAPTTYSASVLLAGEAGSVTSVDLAQAAVEIRQKDVATEAAKALKTDRDPIKLAEDVKTKAVPESLTVSVTAVESTSARAEAVAKAFADAFITVDLERRNASFFEQSAAANKVRDNALADLQQFQFDHQLELAQPQVDPTIALQLQGLQNRVNNAEQRISDLGGQIESPYRVNGVTQAERVAAGKLALPQSRAVRGMVTIFVALMGAILLVALIERLNPRIDTPKDAEDIIGAPVLGMVPIMRGKRKKIVDRADLSQFSGPFAESFRAMRAHLDFRSAADELDRPPCVMVVSSAPGEGKTTTTAFLGLSYQEVGRDAVVVGGDFRRPAIHRLFGVPRAPGLSSRLLANQTPTSTAEVVRSIVKRDEVTGVRVIPSGPGTDRVTGLLSDLSAVTAAGIEAGCTVIIDTAPVMVANDAIDFLPFVDWVIVVVRLGKTTARSLRQSIASLELNNARIAGCAMMGSLESVDAKRYYYSYYRVEDDPEMAAYVPPPASANGSGAASSNGSMGSAAAEIRRAEPASAAEPPA